MLESEPTALDTLKTILPPEPVPLPCPPCNVKSPPAILFVVPAVVVPPEIVSDFPAVSCCSIDIF